MKKCYKFVGFTEGKTRLRNKLLFAMINNVKQRKVEKKDTGLSHVIPFSPYKKDGYAGFADLILTIKDKK